MVHAITNLHELCIMLFSATWVGLGLVLLALVLLQKCTVGTAVWILVAVALAASFVIWAGEDYLKARVLSDSMGQFWTDLFAGPMIVTE